MTTRRWAILGGLALIGAGPARRPTPMGTAQALYTSIPLPTPLGLLSARLRALFRKDAARRDRKLDFEWRSGGEGGAQLSDIHLRLIGVKGQAATIEASFYNGGERRFRRFFLIREAGRWVIDDALLVPENGKLSDFLRGKG